jgi:hypothetical protein
MTVENVGRLGGLNALNTSPTTYKNHFICNSEDGKFFINYNNNYLNFFEDDVPDGASTDVILTPGTNFEGFEPPRDCRRHFRLSHAAMADCFIMA